MGRITWIKPVPQTLGLLQSDIPAAKGALIAWRKSDGLSSQILNDYGLHPLDWDLTTESVRDMLVLNEFAKWWNAQNYSPTLSTIPNTAAPGFPTNAALQFNDPNVAALKVWATGKANIPTGPPSLPQGTYPPPPGWPQGVPFPPPAPPGWPQGVPFPPLGNTAPAGWPQGIPYPPPAPTGWPSNFPFPIQIPSGWTNPSAQPTNPPPSNPPPPPPPSQQPPQPPPASPGGTSSASKSTSVWWLVGAVVLGGIALIASSGGARVSNPLPLLPNARRGIYGGSGAADGDYVIYVHGTSGRHYVDRVDDGGTHVLIGAAAGYASWEAAVNAAERDAKRSGVRGYRIHGQNSDGSLFEVDTSVRENPSEVDEDAARELQLYLDNDARFSPDSSTGKGHAVRVNLKKKFAKGTYDRERAIDGWMYVVDDAAKAYAKEFGGGTWHQIFNAPTRRRVATELEAYGRQAFESGEW